jgi:Domain of unknown function (DUF5063)
VGDVENFMAVAHRYCAFIEATNALDRGVLVRELEGHLVSLYGAALLLPDAGASDRDAPDPMTREEQQALHRRLSGELGDLDFYQMMFDPYDWQDETPVTGSLADDMADIYLDLRKGFVVIEAGGTLDDAVWEWRFGFDHHWGRHAAHALYAAYVLAHD